MFFDLRGLKVETELAKRFLLVSDGIFERDFADNAQREDWQIFASASALLTIFSAFEKRFTAAIYSFTAFLDNNEIESFLEVEHKEPYKRSVAAFLGKLNHEKYQHISEVTVVERYLKFIANSGAPRFTPEAVLLRDQNLRVDTINEILCRVGLRNFEDWIVQYDPIRDRYEGIEVLKRFKSDWSQMIKVRNEVAHGTLSEVPGPGIFLDYVGYTTELSGALEEFLLHAAIELDINNKVFSVVGDVSEYFEHPNAVIVPAIAPRLLRTSDTLFFLRDHLACQVRLESIMVNDDKLEELTIDTTGIEIGLRMSAGRKKPKVGSKIYCLSPGLAVDL